MHGNAWALEAVLADIACRRVDFIVNLGDNANGPGDPRRSVQLLRCSGAVHVRGNGDRMTAEGGESARRSAHFARERLNDSDLHWLKSLPFSAQGEGWIAFHASPASDEGLLLENVVSERLVPATDAVIRWRLRGIDTPLILAGHTHIPRIKTLSDGRTVVNPGSVGLPAFRDPGPPPYWVENGSPDARYSILRRRNGGWSAEFARVKYDFKAAANAAWESSWAEWASWVKTGLATV